MKNITAFLLSTFLIIGLSTTAFGQNSDNADIAANAEVLSGITVSGDSDLTFGDVSPGVAKTINYADAEAGQFTVQAGENSSVDLTFDLSDLSDGSGGYALTNSSNEELPLAFSSTTANWEEDGTSASAGNNEFDPTSSEQIDSFPGNDINVYLGGEVNPGDNQNAGTYNGTITLTATYN